MSSQSKVIQLTLRLENALYREFHEAVQANGHSHVAVLRLLVKEWVASKKSHPAGPKVKNI